LEYDEAHIEEKEISTASECGQFKNSSTATVFMPLTFLAGVYGMNFKYMPELELHWGYFFIRCIMLVITIAMLIYFRRKKWL